MTMTTTIKTVCHVCGANPCYGICPMADPYAGDPQREHDDHEAGAMYDDMAERYAGEALGREEAEADECFRLELETNRRAALSPDERAAEDVAAAAFVAEHEAYEAARRARIEAERAACEAEGGVWF